MGSKRRLGSSVAIGLVVSTGGWLGALPGAAAAEPAVKSYDSLSALQRFYDIKLTEQEKAIEAERLAALESYRKSASDKEQETLLQIMTQTAMFLNRFEQVIKLTDAFLLRFPDGPGAWEVREQRFEALIERNQAATARKEWEAATTPLDRQVWREALGSSLKIGYGLSDADKVAEAKTFYDLLKKRFSFVTDLAEILDRRTLWVGKPPAVMEGADLDGRPVDMNDYKGKVVLIDFWATNCPPCLASFPDLIATYKAHHDQGFEILGVSLDRNVDLLKNFLKASELPWRQLCDGKSYYGPNARKFDINAIPATFLVNRAGKIVRVGILASEVEPVVRRLLAAPAAGK